MALTEEQEIARAYNIGRMLSKYAPELLQKIITANEDNELVKTMSKAKEHYELDLKNINKEHSPEVIVGEQYKSEKSQDFKPDWLKSDRLTNALEDREINPEKDKDMDIDHEK